MDKNKLAGRGFLNALGTAVYILLVAVIMSNAEKLPSNKPGTFLAPLAFLSLFVLSATVVGTFMLGKPILLYLDGEKPAGIKLFLYSLLWFAIITSAVLIILIAF